MIDITNPSLRRVHKSKKLVDITHSILSTSQNPSLWLKANENDIGEEGQLTGRPESTYILQYSDLIPNMLREGDFGKLLVKLSKFP